MGAVNKGYQNLKALEDATVAAVHYLENMIIAEGNTASHQLGEMKHELLSVLANDAESMQGRITENANDIATVGDRFYDFKSRSFWSRLNWLVTGR